MSRLTRDGTAKSVSRNRILRREREQEIFLCSADHGQDWQAYPQLPPVIGAPRICCGHASGISFPRLLWFGGCATHVTQCSVPGYSYFTMCSEKSEHKLCYKLLVHCSNPRDFFFIRVFKEVIKFEFVQ